MIGGELGGLGGEDEAIEAVDEVEHLDAEEDFDAALKATGLAQFTKPASGTGIDDIGGMSYGQMLEEPDDGGFDFESMLAESTSVLGGLGLDGPLSDLSDLQDDSLNQEAPTNAWALPAGGSVAMAKGQGKTGSTSSAIAGVGKATSTNNKGKSLLSALQSKPAAQPAAAPAPQQQQRNAPPSGNAWAQGPPNMAQAPPGQVSKYEKWTRWICLNIHESQLRPVCCGVCMSSTPHLPLVFIN